MITSEGNKPPAVSLEVKNWIKNWFFDEMVQRHIWSVTFFRQEEKKPGARI